MICCKNTKGKMRFSTRVLSQRQNTTNSHAATRRQRQFFFFPPDIRISWFGFSLRTLTSPLPLPLPLSLLKDKANPAF